MSLPWHAKARPTEAHVLVWRWRQEQSGDQEKQSGDQASGPKICMCGLALGRDGIELMSAGAVRAVLDDPDTWSWMLRAGATLQDVKIVESGGRERTFREEDPGGNTPDARRTTRAELPDWPGVLFEDSLVQAFENARPVFAAIGADPGFAPKAFKAAAGTRALERVLEALPEDQLVAFGLLERLLEDERLAFRKRLERGRGSDPNIPADALLCWQPLPFYRGYGLLSFRAPTGRRLTPWLICTKDLADADKMLKWQAGERDLEAFENKLNDAQRLFRTAQTALEYVRFRLKFSRTRLVELEVDLPVWLSQYEPSVAVSLSPHLRPVMRLCEVGGERWSPRSRNANRAWRSSCGPWAQIRLPGHAIRWCAIRIKSTRRVHPSTSGRLPVEHRGRSASGRFSR